jgi:hypothetical protein
MTRIRFDGCDLSPRSRTPRCFAQAIAAVFLLCLLLAGCGSDRMSKADYERTVNDAGRKLSAVFSSADQGTRNLSQFSVRVQRAKRTLDGVVSDLGAVEPPAKAERAHASLLTALETLSQDMQRLAQAAASGYPQSVAEARARLSAPARQLVTAIQQLQQAGFDINTGR